jgi:hypothetical protein
MWKKILVPALTAAALQTSPLHAGQVMMGVGLGFFAEDGLDLQVSYLPSQSHWLYAYRYFRGTNTFNDPFTDRALTKTTDTMSGPLVNYLFRPQARGTAYVGASLLSLSRKERSLITGEVGTDSTTALFIGGGFMGSIDWFHYNAGFFLAPGVKLRTSTSVSSEDQSGAFDIQLQVGIRF